MSVPRGLSLEYDVPSGGPSGPGFAFLRATAPGLDVQRRHYEGIDTLVEAARISTMCVSLLGGRHAHQRRLRKVASAFGQTALSGQLGSLSACAPLEELHNL